MEKTFDVNHNYFVVTKFYHSHGLHDCFKSSTIRPHAGLVAVQPYSRDPEIILQA